MFVNERERERERRTERARERERARSSEEEDGGDAPKEIKASNTTVDDGEERERDKSFE